MMQHIQSCLSLACSQQLMPCCLHGYCLLYLSNSTYNAVLSIAIHKNPHLLFSAVLPPHTFVCCTGCTKCTRSKPCAVFDAITAGEGAACNSEQTGTHRASSGGVVHLHGMRYPTEEPCGMHPMWAHLLLWLLDEGEGWRRARLS